MHTLKVKMVTPERVLFEGDALSVTAMTMDGQITVLPAHIPLVSILQAGEVLIKQEKGSVPLVVSGGFLEVTKEEVIILADTAEHVHELDLSRAQKAVELAQSLLQAQTFDVNEYETLKTNLDKHRVRVSAFTKWRK